jgi:hypothetical protein
MSVAIVDPRVASERYPHGTHARYALGKCRCFACKVGHADYIRDLNARSRKTWRVQHVNGGWIVRNVDTGEVLPKTTVRAIAMREAARRQRDVEPSDEARDAQDRTTVSTREARAHLVALKRAGVGLRTVSERSGLARNTLKRIMGGGIRRTRRRTAEAILGVVAVPRGSVPVGAGPTWQLIGALLGIGYTKNWIAKMLGMQPRKNGYHALQLKRDRVTAINAARVQRLYAHVWRNDARLREHVDPGGERRRAEDAARAKASPQARLAAVLGRMDADEFSIRFARLGDVG